MSKSKLKLDITCLSSRQRRRIFLKEFYNISHMTVNSNSDLKVQNEFVNRLRELNDIEQLSLQQNVLREINTDDFVENSDSISEHSRISTEESSLQSSISDDEFCNKTEIINIRLWAIENYVSHRCAIFIYLTRRRGLSLNTHLDKQIEIERKYWRQVAERLVAVICTLAERGLAFRGDIERFGALHNGNYLEILKDLKKAGYFSLSVNSTPDLSHVDQLAVIVRYVSPDDGLQLNDHSGKNIANVVFNYLENNCKIDFNKCRGQSYDNAANISRMYNGMQKILLDKNKFAVYIPCGGHSLNLIGRVAVDCCLPAVNFFAIIEQVYTFFSASTKRWIVLKSCLVSDSTVPKRLCDTRWEAHAKAVSAISDGYESIIDALHCLYTNEYEKGDTRREAGILQEKMEELEFVFMLEFWNTFHIYVKMHHAANNQNLNRQDLYQIIFKDKLNLAFSNVEATLRLFLSLMVTNCSGERLFSGLKRLKNELRTTMLQEKLSDLAILCIEAEKLRTLSFDNIIDDFAKLKSRKKFF
ncbi:hypothetical protein ALC57_00366 [Trachymyrmex cornetzi]|uniref:HAT C-terminal dimerisation domain-containing protein n=1 Tax=Trachymyrmex cornetzi TaxID=471704 RepID=A0A151JSI1_9HYME|nr:hypothetical protein ALC57_00366 [Trachymyrmex cornetzi]